MSGLIVVATTTAGGALGFGAGWLLGFTTSEWSMEGVGPMLAKIAAGTVAGAAVGAYVGGRLVG